MLVIAMGRRHHGWVGLLVVLLALAACTVLASTMRASPQGGGFWEIRLYCPVSKVHGVFSNTVLASSSEKQPKATVIVFIVWGLL